MKRKEVTPPLDKDSTLIPAAEARERALKRRKILEEDEKIHDTELLWTRIEPTIFEHIEDGKLSCKIDLDGIHRGAVSLCISKLQVLGYEYELLVTLLGEGPSAVIVGWN